MKKLENLIYTLANALVFYRFTLIRWQLKKVYPQLSFNIYLQEIRIGDVIIYECDGATPVIIVEKFGSTEYIEINEKHHSRKYVVNRILEEIDYLTGKKIRK